MGRRGRAVPDGTDEELDEADEDNEGEEDLDEEPNGDNKDEGDEEVEEEVARKRLSISRTKRLRWLFSNLPKRMREWLHVR